MLYSLFNIVYRLHRLLILLPYAVLGGVSDSVFTDDAIRIEKYYDEFRKKPDLKGLDIQTRGSITLHINSNRDGNGRHYENWLDYAVQWWASSRLTFGIS